MKAMKLFFYGAAKEVTGSCYCLDVNGKKLLIDCGLQQGKDEKDDQRLPFMAKDINYVVLTHAHIDHSGRLPLLVKEGFQGKIVATKATCDLISIMLRDSAHIQEMDAKWENNRGKRSGKNEVKPLYSMTDAENTLNYLVPCNYGVVEKLCDGVEVSFVDAGHILGSASVEMFLKEGESSKKIVFSGDIGNTNQPIINDPQYIKEADYVVMESTYGNKNHEKSEDHTLDFAKIIDQTLAKGGNVIIPSFAVGRTQDLLYYIREIKEKRLVTSHPNFPVYVDSPLATEATKIYDENLIGYADPESRVIMNRGNDPLIFPNLHFTDSTEESKALNFDTTPKVIISSSGMCDAGRIRQHLKYNLWRRECAVIFVGFQANGTLGRILLEGAKKVKIFGEEIVVLATVHSFSGLSAHADKDGLLKWINSFAKKPSKVFVTHGEDLVCDEFVNTISELGFSAVAPLYKAIYDLNNGELIEEGIEIEKKVFSIEKAKAISVAYANLLSANTRLLEAINHNKSGANKDLEKFATEILKMAEKWDRE
jgi:metallo-beta-lactamase family protein